MSTRQVANVITNVEYTPGQYRQIANVLLEIEYVPTVVFNYGYDRNSAAQLAIDRSQNNFANFPTDAAGVGIPGGNGVYGKVNIGGNARDYSCYLSHQLGATGSSTWISEIIHDGGALPMTVNPSPNETICDDVIGPFNSKGWRVCPSGSANCTQYGSANGNWSNHDGIVQYFGSFFSTLEEFQLGNVDPEVVKTAIYFDDAEGSNLAGKIRPGQASILEGLFTSGDLATVERGDYTFVDLEGVSNHGFIVVGWGPVQDTIPRLNYTNLSSQRSATNTVPYVADFCFGTDQTPSQPGTDFGTGWLQDPRPRPFYASAVLMSTARLENPADGYEASHTDYTIDQYKIRLREEKYQPFTKPDMVTRPTWVFYRIPASLNLSSLRIYLE